MIVTHHSRFVSIRNAEGQGGVCCCAQGQRSETCCRWPAQQPEWAAFDYCDGPRCSPCRRCVLFSFSPRARLPAKMPRKASALSGAHLSQRLRCHASCDCVPCAGRARSEPNESDDDDHDEAGAAAPRNAAAAPGAAAQLAVDDDAAAPVIVPLLPVQGAAANVVQDAELPPRPSRRSCTRRRFAATPVAVVNVEPSVFHFMFSSAPPPQCRIYL